MYYLKLVILCVALYLLVQIQHCIMAGRLHCNYLISLQQPSEKRILTTALIISTQLLVRELGHLFSGLGNQRQQTT